MCLINAVMSDTGFIIETSLYLVCNEKHFFFFTSEDHKHYTLCSCKKVCKLLFFLDNVFIRFSTKLSITKIRSVLLIHLIQRPDIWMTY